MADYEEQLLRETLLAAYRDIVPEHSTLGETLCRKLAAGLYQRGGRIHMGDPPPKPQTLHMSVDFKDNIVWTCKVFHSVLGYKPHSLIGKSIYSILGSDSAAFRRDTGMPTLLRTGKVGPVITSFMTKQGSTIMGSVLSVIMNDSSGQFLRTFTRIKIALFLYLAG
jgi:hypothetical protein